MIYYDLVNEKYIYEDNFYLNNNYFIKNGYNLIYKKKLTDKSFIIFYKNKEKYICIYNQEEANNIVIFIDNSDQNLFEEEKIKYLINYNIYKKSNHTKYCNILNNVLKYLKIKL